MLTSSPVFLPQFVAQGNSLLQVLLTMLRNSNTNPRDFRATTRNLTAAVLLEAMKDAPMDQCEILSPMGPTTGHTLRNSVTVVPVVRAGLGMVEPVLDFFPDAKVCHVVIQRDHDTAEPKLLLDKLAKDLQCDFVLLVDPMIATGGSSCDAIRLIKMRGAVDIRLLCMIAAPEGIKRIQETHPDVRIYGVVCDERLDHRKYIIPGLGDAGDRLYNTPNC